VILGFCAIFFYWHSYPDPLSVQPTPPPPPPPPTTTTTTTTTPTTTPVTTTATTEKCTHLNGELSVLIKTMGRSEKVIEQVNSIEKLYPNNFTILIGDDGKVNESNIYQRKGILQRNRIQYFWFGFDFGVSESRNQLVNLTETKYVINMDDDMLWTEDTKVVDLYDIFCRTQADIITMSLDQSWSSTYQGELYVDNGTNIFCLHSPAPPPLVPNDCNNTNRQPTTDSQQPNNATPFRQRILLDAQYQCYQTDIGYTMYLSTREFLLLNPWKGLIGAEHIAWFWGMKNRPRPVKVVACAKITVQHKYSYTAVWKGYNSLRRRAYNNGLAYRWKHLQETDHECCRLSRHSLLYRDKT